VQKFARFILVSIAGLSILGAVVFLALNLYVQSEGTQARIQQELRQRFGATLTIGRISVTPWSGLKLSGITMAQGANGANGAAGNFLEAENFGLRIAFFSVFSRRLVIKEVSLVGPKVVWPQNADGKWRLPDLRGERSESNAAPTIAEPENLPSEEPRTGKPATETPAAQTKTTPSAQIGRKTKAEGTFISEIHKVSLTDGNFRFLGRANDLVANFEGVGFRAAISNALALKGNARVARVSLRDRFFLQQLRSPLRYDANGLDLSQISAQVSGEN